MSDQNPVPPPVIKDENTESQQLNPSTNAETSSSVNPVPISDEFPEPSPDEPKSLHSLKVISVFKVPSNPELPTVEYNTYEPLLPKTSVLQSIIEAHDSDPPPTEANVVVPAPSQTLVVAPPPSETQVVAPPPSETQVVAPPPSETQVVAPPPSQTQVVAPPPSQTQVVAPPPSQTQVVAPPPSQTQVVAPPPSQTQVVAPPPMETNVVAPPPSETNVVVPPPSEINAVAPPPPENVTVPSSVNPPLLQSTAKIPVSNISSSVESDKMKNSTPPSDQPDSKLLENVKSAPLPQKIRSQSVPEAKVSTPLVPPPPPPSQTKDSQESPSTKSTSAPSAPFNNSAEKNVTGVDDQPWQLENSPGHWPPDFKYPGSSQNPSERQNSNQPSPLFKPTSSPAPSEGQNYSQPQPVSLPTASQTFDDPPWQLENLPSYWPPEFNYPGSSQNPSDKQNYQPPPLTRPMASQTPSERLINNQPQPLSLPTASQTFDDPPWQLENLPRYWPSEFNYPGSSQNPSENKNYQPPPLSRPTASQTLSENQNYNQPPPLSLPSASQTFDDPSWKLENLPGYWPSEFNYPGSSREPSEMQNNNQPPQLSLPTASQNRMGNVPLINATMPPHGDENQQWQLEKIPPYWSTESNVPSKTEGAPNPQNQMQQQNGFDPNMYYGNMAANNVNGNQWCYDSNGVPYWPWPQQYDYGSYQQNPGSYPQWYNPNTTQDLNNANYQPPSASNGNRAVCDEKCTQTWRKPTFTESALALLDTLTLYESLPCNTCDKPESERDPCQEEGDFDWLFSIVTNIYEIVRDLTTVSTGRCKDTSLPTASKVPSKAVQGQEVDSGKSENVSQPNNNYVEPESTSKPSAPSKSTVENNVTGIDDQIWQLEQLPSYWPSEFNYPGSSQDPNERQNYQPPPLPKPTASQTASARQTSNQPRPSQPKASQKPREVQNYSEPPPFLLPTVSQTFDDPPWQLENLPTYWPSEFTYPGSSQKPSEKQNSNSSDSKKSLIELATTSSQTQPVANSPSSQQTDSVEPATSSAPLNSEGVPSLSAAMKTLTYPLPSTSSVPSSRKSL